MKKWIILLAIIFVGGLGFLVFTGVNALIGGESGGVEDVYNIEDQSEIDETEDYSVPVSDYTVEIEDPELLVEELGIRMIDPEDIEEAFKKECDGSFLQRAGTDEIYCLHSEGDTATINLYDPLNDPDSSSIDVYEE